MNKKADIVIDELVETLTGIEIFWIKGNNHSQTGAEVKIRAAIIPHSDSNKTSSKGSFIISPGRGEYIEKYTLAIKALNERGFDVLIVDQRGQGLSDRLGKDYMSGHIDSFDLMGRHLAQSLEALQEKLPKPHYMLCHSMGGMVGLDILIKNYVPSIEAAIFCAPMWWLKPIRFARQIAQILCLLGLGGNTVPTLNHEWQIGEFANNDVTNDAQCFERNNILMQRDPRLQIGASTNHWIADAYKIMSGFKHKNLAKIKIPILILSAGAESIVDIDAQFRIANQLPNAKIITIEGAKHEIMVELPPIRAKFWALIDEFMANLPPKTNP